MIFLGWWGMALPGDKLSTYTIVHYNHTRSENNAQSDWFTHSLPDNFSSGLHHKYSQFSTIYLGSCWHICAEYELKCMKYNTNVLDPNSNMYVLL